MDIAHLKTFLAVLKTGGFSEAGKVIHRSQPAVSLQIKELEEELGVRLIERFGPMKVHPTKEGLVLQELSSSLVRDFASLKKTFDEARGAPGSVEIRIATHEVVMTYFLPDHVQLFVKKHPEAKFSFLRESRDKIISTVQEGEADLGITSLEKTPRGVVYQQFAIHRRVLICPKNHPLSKETSVKPEDIVKYPLILPASHSETRGVINEVFKKHSLTYQMPLEFSGREAVKIYVERGFGVSVLNDYYLFPEDKKKLAIIDVSKYFGTTQRGLLYRKGKRFSPLQQEFVDSILATR